MIVTAIAVECVDRRADGGLRASLHLADRAIHSSKPHRVLTYAGIS